MTHDSVPPPGLAAQPGFGVRDVPAGGAPPPSPSHELRTLIHSSHAGVALETDEEERALALIDQAGYELRLPVYDWTLTQGLALRGAPQTQAIYETTQPAAAMKNAAAIGGEAIYVMRDLRRMLGEPSVSRALRDLLDAFEARPQRSTIVVLGTHPELPAEVRDRLVHLPLGLPGQAEYRAMLDALITSLTLGRRSEVALAPHEIDKIAAALRGLTLGQARQAVARAAIEDGRLDLHDLPRLVEHKTRTLQTDGLLEYFPPGDNPATLGGFERLHAWLDRTRVAFSPEARDLNLPMPKGVLLTGVQGCGKSLAAKAIARSWTMPLLRLDAGRLYDKYIGESERNLRRALAVAEAVAPSVLWIDEIEKAVTAQQGDGDGGVSQRLLATLLTWMAERTTPVFVVATANDIFRLPPELTRKGRFDELFFVDLPTATEREAILGIHLRLRKQDPGRVDLAAIVAATDGFSGAELEQIIVGALLESLHRGEPAITESFLREVAATVPLSVSRAEDIAKLRETAKGRFVPVA